MANPFLLPEVVTMNPHDALVDEFGSYYQADELALFLHEDLDSHADDSAKRLARVLGESALQAAALLRDAAADRTHPLVGAIEYETAYGWTGSEDDWVLFQYLVRRIADGLHEWPLRTGQ